MRTIRAGHVLGRIDPSDTGPAAISIAADGRIDRIDRVAPAELSPEEAGRLVMPALTDAHDHGRGLSPLAFGADDQPLESWIVALRKQPRVDPYLNAAVALARLAGSGVGAVTHCHNTQDGTALLAEAEAISRAARDVGIHVGFAWPFFDRNAMVYGEIEPLRDRVSAEVRARYLASPPGFRDCATNMRLFDQAQAFEHAHFRLQYHPVGPQWVEDGTLRAIASRSVDDGRRVHMHLFETRVQREWADHVYPDGLIHFLDEIGLLTPRLTVAHACWLRAEEIGLLADRGVTISVNLSSNLRLRSGRPPIAEFLRAGVALAYGLDGMALDDDQDMLRELRLALLASGDHGAVAALRVLERAWSAGRRTIVGEDGGGRIAAGAPADFAVLDYADLTADCIAPHLKPLTLLLARGQRRHVRQLFVSGREIVVDGRCTSVDLPALQSALLREARAAYGASPPPVELLDALGEGLSRYYADCCHVGHAGACGVWPGR